MIGGVFAQTAVKIHFIPVDIEPRGAQCNQGRANACRGGQLGDHALFRVPVCHSTYGG